MRTARKSHYRSGNFLVNNRGMLVIAGNNLHFCFADKLLVICFGKSCNSLTSDPGVTHCHYTGALAVLLEENHEQADMGQDPRKICDPESPGSNIRDLGVF